MAYFPNGTAGMCYEEEYCSNCVHSGEDGVSCAVMLIHNLYNYDQCNQGKTSKAIKSILELLIPTTKDGIGAEQCEMFLATADAEAAEVERRRLAEQPRKYEQIMREMRVA